MLEAKFGEDPLEPYRCAILHINALIPLNEIKQEDLCTCNICKKNIKWFGIRLHAKPLRSFFTILFFNKLDLKYIVLYQCHTSLETKCQFIFKTE